MAIKVNLSTGTQQMGASSADKVLHNNTNRTAISGFSIYNSLAINVEVTIYESPDNTSASGEQVANFTLGPKGGEDDSIEVIEVIGQGYQADQRIIAVINTAAVLAGELTAKLTYSQYTGDS